MPTTIDQRTNREHAAQVQETMARAQQQGEASNEAVAALNQRIAAAEQNIEEIRKHFATLQANVAGDLYDFETNLKAQGAAIDSARTATAQTDDLLERVVEALDQVHWARETAQRIDGAELRTSVRDRRNEASPSAK
jgi:hypothetical protein